MNIIEYIVSFLRKIFNKENTEINSETIVNEEVVKGKEEIMEEKNNEITPIEEYKKQFNNLVVVLDPGHAVTTNGKKSPYSLGLVSEPKLPFEEWKFNREICDRLCVLLRERGVEVFFTTDATRDKDIDLGLSKRAERANSYVQNTGKKGVYISVHANAHGNGNEWTNAKGWSAYTTKGQNRSDILADCLYDYAEQLLVPEGISIRTDKSDGDRDWEENFTVLVKANMPAVLTENLFYTNKIDTEFLNTEKGMDIITKIHFYGILKFAEKEYNM